MFTETPIHQLIGKNAKLSAHVGVEIEAEHTAPVSTLPEALRSRLRVEGDGSLRHNGAEYVFKKPSSPSVAKKVVMALGKHLDDNNPLLPLGHAGVHVHVNVSDLSVRQLINFVAVAHVLDDMLVNWCGQFRQGNLFCLRLRDAEGLIPHIQKMLEREDLGLLHTDRIRYSSVNLKSVPQYGSLEFRALASDGDWEKICVWIDTLVHLKEVARELDSPIQIVSQCSEMLKDQFVDHLLGPYAEHFPKYQGFDEDIMASIRRVQQYAYAKEW